ncbi:polyprenyl synthetase family protein [Kibdelosporangium persicum]|uniref:Geranylgeranyl diphosphate synthase type I n=1 Tax=Kibdelosporangium persicum TaxID=2698649 RepID=A0ABX2F4X4_9PSEU|nr:polyprenyl synthetase family protein [Kibdelosporangium persicum]NRN66398.1 Geranylgeranyl diphosphate synthase type I [Kibdelosporangium persicum]
MSGHVTIDAIGGDAGPRDRSPSAPGHASLVDKVGERLAGRWQAESSLLAAMCEHALVPTGKLFRPILLLESACAVGGDADVVLPAAVGAECGHVASLVHDDIIDNDDLRRGRPSVQFKFGADNAIVAGDALIFDLFAALAECRHTGARPDRIVAALDVVARCGIDLCRGQSLEAELCERVDFDLDAYLTMVKLKTAALFKGACECGALLAGGEEHMVRALGTYAENLGCAFQIHDDVMSYTRDTDVMGKPDTSDIRNGRLTLPVILAYRTAEPHDRLAITEVLVGQGDPAARRSTLMEILDRTGAINVAAEMARQYCEQAIAALQVLPPTPSRERLASFAQAAIDRDR